MKYVTSPSEKKLHIYANPFMHYHTHVCITNIHIVLLSHSLLVAIGIEAFNKFSQEQKEEKKEVDSQFPSSIPSTNTSRTFKENMSHYGKKFLAGIGYFAKVAFSSARVSENGLV